MKVLAWLAALAVLGYLGYAHGLPWFEARQQMKAAATEEEDLVAASRACVRLAREAAAAVVDELAPQAGPGADRATWSLALARVGARLTKADGACRCGSASCLQATVALSEVRVTFESLTGAVRRGTASPDVGVMIERVDRKLDEAERLVGS